MKEKPMRKTYTLKPEALEKFITVKNDLVLRWTIYIRFFKNQLLEFAQDRQDLILMSLIHNLEEVLWRRNLQHLNDKKVMKAISLVIKQYNETTSQLVHPFDIECVKDGKHLKIEKYEERDGFVFMRAKYKNFPEVVYTYPVEPEEEKEIRTFDGDSSEQIDYANFMDAFSKMLAVTKEVAIYQTAVLKKYKRVTKAEERMNFINGIIISDYLQGQIKDFVVLESDEMHHANNELVEILDVCNSMEAPLGLDVLQGLYPELTASDASDYLPAGEELPSDVDYIAWKYKEYPMILTAHSKA